MKFFIKLYIFVFVFDFALRTSKKYGCYLLVTLGLLFYELAGYFIINSSAQIFTNTKVGLKPKPRTPQRNQA